MFKRANKITALLVAAASVMSIVPAMAADSTSKLDTKDGTIKNAVAYSDGKYVFQGYKSSDDSDAIYYNGGDKDKALDDVSSADLNTTYENKYAFANDGSDQYLIDLTNGTVTDDDTPSDDIDTAATKLQTKLKKADRYGDSISVSSETNLGYSGADDATGTLPGNKYGDSWYAYSVKSSTNDAKDYISNEGNLYGFTDGTGKYVDASYTANVYAYSTKQGKTVKIENFSNNIDDVDDDSKLLATLVDQPVVLTQDKDYIYTLTKVAITDTASNAVVTNGVTTSAAAYVNGGDSYKTTIRTYLQKIAKAQSSDQKDGAYLPKSVDSYEIGNKDGDEFDCGDAKDAYTAIGDALGQADLTKVTQADAVNTVDGVVKAKFTVVGGKLVAIDADTEQVKATTINLKKDKVKFESDSRPAYKSSAQIDADTKVDVYFAEKDSDDSQDITDGSSTEVAKAYDIDVDGNVWMIGKGKIYKYAVGGDFAKVYGCDSSLDGISVYDENSLIAWSNNDDVYTTVKEGKVDNTPAPTTPAKVGWDQLADGTWNLYDATGAKVTANWSLVGGAWYYFKQDGAMATGWQLVGGTWYYLNPVSDGTKGAMKTGWIQDGGAWYYLNASGAMLANTTTPDGYYVGANGAWIG